jgi:hypothetical protein
MAKKEITVENGQGISHPLMPKEISGNVRLKPRMRQMSLIRLSPNACKGSH